MLNICNSQNCKMILLIFVIILAGYMIITNSKQKTKEFFEADEAQPSCGDIGKDKNKSVEEKIKAIYKKVYFRDIPVDELKRYSKELNESNFDAEAFCRSLTIERTAEIQDMIHQTFMKTLGRPATPQEMDKYTEMFLTGKLTSPEQLVRILSNSPENVKSVPKVVQSQFDNKDYTIYKQVIDVYQKVLDRLPNSQELNFYFTKLKGDKVFTVDKLEDALLASREHTILTMNQKNQVYGDLMGNITERQLQIIITNMYKSVYQTNPDKATYDFVKAKFLSFHLDEEKLVLFLKELKSLEQGRVSNSAAPKQENATVGGSGGASTGSGKSVTAKAQVTVFLLKDGSVVTTPDKQLQIKDLKATKNGDTVTLIDAITEKEQSGYKINNVVKEDITYAEFMNKNSVLAENKIKGSELSGQDNKVVIESFIDVRPDISRFLLSKPEHFTEDVGEEARQDAKEPVKTGDPDERKSVNLYTPQSCEDVQNNILKKAGESDPRVTERIIESIKNSGKCGFDKDRLEKVLELNDKQLYADYVSSRNNQLSCQADKTKYDNANNNMVLYPEFKWMVPQQRPPVCYGKGNYYQPLVDQTALIGTLLNDAKCTQVGSIMPSFDYKEKIPEMYPVQSCPK
jgi:hypothetical protein